ncbi:MAG: hypothetical protein J2P44_05180 [Candidatus Dormibacteraeota bacterium]|nr:hypothetical protein [Candidatus Dormibacteraeota bacterium]
MTSAPSEDRQRRREKPRICQEWEARQMDHQPEDAIPVLRQALGAAAWEDAENAETLVRMPDGNAMSGG